MAHAFIFETKNKVTSDKDYLVIYLVYVWATKNKKSHVLLFKAV